MFELSLNKNSVRDWEDLYRHGAALSMARGSTNAVSASRRDTGLWLSRLLLTRTRQPSLGYFSVIIPGSLGSPSFYFDFLLSIGIYMEWEKQWVSFCHGTVFKSLQLEAWTLKGCIINPGWSLLPSGLINVTLGMQTDFLLQSWWPPGQHWDRNHRCLHLKINPHMNLQICCPPLSFRYWITIFISTSAHRRQVFLPFLFSSKEMLPLPESLRPGCTRCACPPPKLLSWRGFGHLGFSIF